MCCDMAQLQLQVLGPALKGCCCVSVVLHLVYEVLRLGLPSSDGLTTVQRAAACPSEPCGTLPALPAGFIHTDVNRTFLVGNVDD